MDEEFHFSPFSFFVTDPVRPTIIYSIDEFAEKYGMMGGLVQEPVMAILIVPKAELLIG